MNRGQTQSDLFPDTSNNQIHSHSSGTISWLSRAFPDTGNNQNLRASDTQPQLVVPVGSTPTALQLFASANFLDNDAGAGGNEKIEQMPEYRNIKTFLENLIQLTINRDEDEKTKKTTQQIKNDIKKLMCVENLSLIETFLKPVEDGESYNKLLKISEQLTDEMFNAYSNGLFDSLKTDISGIDAEFEKTIGLSYDVLNASLSKLNITYKDTLYDLFDADNNIKLAVNIIENLIKQVNIISNLETNCASEQLLKSTAKYIHATMQDIDLNALFNKYIFARRKFVAYRNLLQIRNSISNVENEPICTICMSEPIKQVSVPCGHAFCNTCMGKQYSCYICRCRIERKIRLFLN